MSLELDPDPLGLIWEASIPPPRSKVLGFFQEMAKSSPNQLVGAKSGKKGQKDNHCAKSGNKSTIAIRPKPLVIQP